MVILMKRIKNIFENIKEHVHGILGKQLLLEDISILLIIIVIPNAYYVDTHIDICCESKCLNSAHRRIETFAYITPPYRLLILNICISK